ncbi:hypothetical protein [Aliivibrio finisterrensis]|uniref:Uncharacterized protein n=1 Tax=Aliivibrio finisterrensis TaxID=511998 RepID=A0A6N6RPE4_9GAMM|nr:hypothetical protein [Aliivibrio finisterrensis]KAB2823377.1 hypothetical protein F8B77_15900 [Aliivibrio finisterrensis]
MIVRLIFILGSILTFSTFAEEEFQSSICKQGKLLETPITFFVSKSVRDNYSPFVIEGYIKSWLNFSNKTLINSCIPMIRKSVGIIYVDELLGREVESTVLAHNLLEYYYPKLVEQASKESTRYYGVIYDDKFSEFSFDFTGSTHASVNSQFFIINIRSAEYVLEHELGHLIGANHDVETLSYQTEGRPFDLNMWEPLSFHQTVKKYSYGYICGGKGTVMAYADDIHPFYSSPEITYSGIVCGHKDYADNAKVLRDYALSKLSED